MADDVTTGGEGTTAGAGAAAGAANPGDGANDQGTPQGAVSTDGNNGSGSGNPGTDGGGDGAGKATDGGDANEFHGKPESGYTDFTVPEGFKLPDTMVNDFKTIAGEMGLNQAGAQKLIDLQLKNAKAQNDANIEQFNGIKNGWAEEAKKEFGQGFDQTVEKSGKVITQFGDDDLNNLLKDFGLLQNKSWLKFAAKIREAISEDTVVTGSAPAAGKKSAADVMFPSTMGK